MEEQINPLPFTKRVGFCLQECHNLVLRPATIESPINNTEGCNLFARISRLLCVLYQPILLLRPIGAVANPYD